MYIGYIIAIAGVGIAIISGIVIPIVLSFNKNKQRRNFPDNLPNDEQSEFSVQHLEIDNDYYVDDTKIIFIKTCKSKVIRGGKNRLHNRISWFSNEDVKIESLTDDVHIEYIDMPDTNRNYNVVFDHFLEDGEEIVFRVKTTMTNTHKQFQNFFSTEVIVPIDRLSMHLNIENTTIKNLYTQKIHFSPMNERTEKALEYLYHSPFHWHIPNPELNFEYKIYW